MNPSLLRVLRRAWGPGRALSATVAGFRVLIPGPATRSSGVGVSLWAFSFGVLAAIFLVSDDLAVAGNRDCPSEGVMDCCCLSRRFPLLAPPGEPKSCHSAGTRLGSRPFELATAVLLFWLVRLLWWCDTAGTQKFSWSAAVCVVSRPVQWPRLLLSNWHF